MTQQTSTTCPVCSRTSYHPSDVAEGYCGSCHDWTTSPQVPKRTSHITPDQRRNQP